MIKKLSKTQKRKIPIVDFSKFKGKEIAIVDGKVVAKGESSKRVFDKARKLFPNKPTRDIVLLSVPKETVFVYFL